MVRPYAEKESLAAFFLGVSWALQAYAMIGATLTARLAQDGIDKKTVTAFTLAFLVYNLKFLWAWVPMAYACRCWARWASAFRGCSSRGRW